MSHFQKSTPFNIATQGIKSGLAITVSTQGILEPGAVIVDTAVLTLTPFEIVILDGGTVVDVDLATLTLTAFDVAILDVVAVDTAVLTLTSFDVEIDVDIVVALATLTLTAFDVEIDVDIDVDLASLILTTFDVVILDAVLVDLASLVLTGPDVAVNTAIDTNTDIRRGILANEIHIYLINPTLTSTVDSFGFKIIGVDPQHREDYSLQAWPSTDQWGNETRSFLTRRNNEESIRFLSTDFITANNIDAATLVELERIYHGTIYVFDKADPDIFLHVKNVTGHKLFYQLINDTENFNVYLRHLNLIPADKDVIC